MRGERLLYVSSVLQTAVSRKDGAAPREAAAPPGRRRCGSGAVRGRAGNMAEHDGDGGSGYVGAGSLLSGVQRSVGQFPGLHLEADGGGVAAPSARAEADRRGTGLLPRILLRGCGPERKDRALLRMESGAGQRAQRVSERAVLPRHPRGGGICGPVFRVRPAVPGGGQAGHAGPDGGAGGAGLRRAQFFLLSAHPTFSCSWDWRKICRGTDRKGRRIGRRPAGKERRKNT